MPCRNCKQKAYDGLNEDSDHFFVSVCLCACLCRAWLHVDGPDMASARLSVLDNLATVQLCNECDHANDRQRKNRETEQVAERELRDQTGQLTEERKEAPHRAEDVAWREI